MNFELLKENWKNILREIINNTSDDAFSIVNMKTLDVYKSGFESRTQGHEFINDNGLDPVIYKVIKNDFLNSKKDIIQNFKNGK